MTGVEVARQQLEALRDMLQAEGATGSAHYLGVVFTLQTLQELRHCATCQCERLRSDPRVAGNPLSRSWHR